MTNITKAQAKKEFAQRLQSEMQKHGLNQTDLAKKTSKLLKNGKSLGRYSVNLYVAGRTIPRPDILNALAQALNVKPLDLLPTRGVPSASDLLTPFDLKDLGDGRAHLRVDQTVDWPTALEVMKLLKVNKSK